MAKVLVTNHTERKIHLNIPGSAKNADGSILIQPEPLVIPAGETVADGNGTKFVPGQLEVEDKHLELVKDHPVVRHYFSEGHLRVPRKSEVKAEQKSEQKSEPVAPAKTEKTKGEKELKNETKNETKHDGTQNGHPDKKQQDKGQSK